MNKVLLIGRITKDPELKYSANQTAVARLNIAINRPVKDAPADFPSIIVFGKQAENLATYCKKGAKIAVEGRLQTGSYEKDGQKIYTTDVVAERVEFLERAEKTEAPEDEAPKFAALNEDIPF